MYLTQGIHRTLQQDPGRISTVFGDRVRTVAESVDRIARLGGALRGIGVREGDRVAMLALNSDRYHEYLLATWWIGAIAVPVNIRWAPAEIVYCLNDSGARVLLVDELFAGHVPFLEGAVDVVVHCSDGPAPEGMLGYEELLAKTDPVEDLRIGGDATAGIFYTGGTTGEPKGIKLSHANLVMNALGGQAYAHVSSPTGRLLHAAPMFHVAALTSWVGQNTAGGTHVIIPFFDPPAVLKAIEEHRVTTVVLVPVMIQMLLDHPELPGHDLSSCRDILYGASPMPQALLERAMAAFPDSGFVQIYGLTETGAVATMLTQEDHLEKSLIRSAGRAAPHVDVVIAGPDDREVPRGTVGEILLRGDNVMTGYWNKPQETAEALRDGRLHTGDIGYLDDQGFLFIVDRIKDVIVSGGENVYSTEVENALCRHPSVAACAVIGVPDKDWGERVHAVVVLRPESAATADEIRTYAKTLIAGYKAPRTVEFAESLPISAAGKVLKRELRKPYWEGEERGVN
jgi:acyl-CoA synthetase (AMP-forming)/AMP-acid ligase II